MVSGSLMLRWPNPEPKVAQVASLAGVDDIESFLKYGEARAQQIDLQNYRYF
jgi:hypothetical protein